MKLDFNKIIAALGACGTIIGAIAWLTDGASATLILTYIAVAAFGSYIGVWPGIWIALGIESILTSEDEDWLMIFPVLGAIAGALWLTITYDPSEAGDIGRVYGAAIGLLVLGSIVYFFQRSQPEASSSEGVDR